MLQYNKNCKGTLVNRVSLICQTKNIDQYRVMFDDCFFRFTKYQGRSTVFPKTLVGAIRIHSYARMASLIKTWLSNSLMMTNLHFRLPTCTPLSLEPTCAKAWDVNKLFHQQPNSRNG